MYVGKEAIIRNFLFNHYSIFRLSKMAGAASPAYMPLIWPAGHINAAINKDEKEVAPKVVY